jgi:hypothetical protein
MPTAVSDLNSLPTDDVLATRDLLAQMLGDLYPQIHTRGGFIGDAVLLMAGILNEGVANTNIRRYTDSGSLLKISEDPSLADEDTVDAILSNYRVARNTGSQATGNVTVVVSKLLPLTIPNGAIFNANGISFATQAVHAIRTTEAAITLPTDRALTDLGNGRYAFSVPITAQTVGEEGMLRRAATLVPAINIPNFVTAYAESDFVNGVDAETNADLLTRLNEGAAVKAWSNRTTTSAMIRAQEEFADIKGISIIGMGDPEMNRDRHTIWPSSLGGRCDIYMRSQNIARLTAITKMATLIEKKAVGGVWQFEIDVDDAPGFYEVVQITQQSDVSETNRFDADSVTRGFALGSGWQPDIEQDYEAAFSPFQTAVVRFTDTVTNTDSLTVNSSTAEYIVIVRHMPLVAELQEYISGRAVRGPAGDVLVKAAIPCLLTVQFDISKSTTQETPDTAAIANAIADKVNNLGFVNVLHASTIVSTAAPFLSGEMAISNMDMFGRILSPIGRTVFTRNRDQMWIPDLPAEYITGRTTAILLDPQDIAITVKNVALIGD